MASVSSNDEMDFARARPITNGMGGLFICSY
jgi:hypothetical protein